MISDWPTASVIVAGLAALVATLRVLAPFVVGRTSAQAQRAALDDVNKRLTSVEAHLSSGSRRMPGRL